MYVNITGSKNNKDVYIYQSYRKSNGNKKYGKSKEHRPNPLVTMRLFMDADGIPLSFDLFPGNQNEQVTLKPLETKVIRDFDCSEFIFCSDAGLGSKNNRFFNSFGNRSYVITYSLKKMKKCFKTQAGYGAEKRRMIRPVLFIKHRLPVMAK